MAVGMRPKLGLQLQDIAMGTRPAQATMGTGMGAPMQPLAGLMPPSAPAVAPSPSPASGGGFFGENGLGRILAGAIGDGLLQHAGMKPIYAPAMQQRQQHERDLADWGLKRRADLQDALSTYDYKRTHPEPSPVARDAAAWQALPDDQKAAYTQLKQASAGDPDVFITLPNGQVYVGPKSGLAGAMMGGGQAPAKPVGQLRPMGGPGGSSSGAGFRN